MKYKRIISFLVIFIVIMAGLTSVLGILSISAEREGSTTFNSIYNQQVELYSKGIYRNDSVTVASQAVSQDIVTLVLGIPLLLISVIKYRRGCLKAQLILTGTLGYFLYTYTSYAFLAMYNQLFLLYVVLMSVSFFALTLSLMAIDLKKLQGSFNKNLPVRFISGVLIFIAVAIGLMWLGRIIPPLIMGEPPLGIEHYTTLVIQVLDLGFIVPISLLAAFLLLKRTPFGYLLSTLVCIKSITMATAVSAMVVGQILAGGAVSTAEIVVFPSINVIIIFCFYLILKNMDS